MVGSRRPRRGRVGNFTPTSGPIEAATGGRDDGGDAAVSGDTDRDPEADARERLSRHIVKPGGLMGVRPIPVIGG